MLRGVVKTSKAQKVILIITVFSLLMLSTFPSQAGTDNYGNPIPEGFAAQVFDSGSMLFHPVHAWSSLPGSQSGQYGINLSLPVCDSETKSDCISSVSFLGEGEKVLKGRFESYLPFSWDGFWAGCEANRCAPTTPPWKYSPGKIAFEGDVERNIPMGSKPSLWTFPGLEHSGGDKYLVSFVITGMMSDRALPLSRKSRANWNDGVIRVEVSPVHVEENAGWDSIDPAAKSEYIPQSGLWHQRNLWCFSGQRIESAYCVKRVKDNTLHGFEVRASLDLLQEAFSSHGFMVSRTSSARVSSKRVSKKLEVSFAGNASAIASAVGYLPKNEFGFRESIKAVNSSYEESGARNTPVDENDLSGLQSWLQNGGSFTDGSDPGAIGSWASLERAIDFIPTQTDLVWFFRSAGLMSIEYDWLGKCKSKLGLSGVVSSNATVMKPSPPRWNSEEKSLDFKIGSPHFNESGAVATGFYNLSISEAVANCLWGRDVTTAKATISVVNDEGEIKTFTSSMRSADGYLNFQVAGFTYSVNKISISFDSVVGKAKTSVASKTLLCAKGKVTKKVSGKAPKCPKGYKKVA